MVRKTKPKEYLKQSVGFALDPENLRNLDTFVADARAHNVIFLPTMRA